MTHHLNKESNKEKQESSKEKQMANDNHQEQKSLTRQKHKSSHQMKRWGLLGCGIVILAVGGLYYWKSSQYTDHYFPNTRFNRIDIGNKSYEEAVQKIQSKNKKRTLVINIGDKKWKTLDLSKVQNTEEASNVLKQQLKQQKPFEWPKAYFKKINIHVPESTLNQNKVNTQLSTLKEALITYNMNAKPSVNATVVFNESGAEIKEGKKGTKIVVSTAIDGIKRAILHGDKSINLDQYYVKPAITKDSAATKALVDKADDISKMEANLSLNNKKYRIPNKDIMSWLYVNDQGSLAVNQEKEIAYLDKFAAKHNLKGKEVSFKSTKEGTVKVPADVYSWSIKTYDTAQVLSKKILEGKDFTEVPVTDGSASAKGPLIGKNYVEVDLRNQHMYIYKNGKSVLDTDIVSGKPESPTPAGVFYVWNKQRDAVLRGPGYASPVAYWMPIDWTGVGIHDSDWQYAYGGTRWKDGFGSHGCVNTPPATMAKVFKIVPVGTPVIVFN